MKTTTLNELSRKSGDWLKADDVAPFLRSDPNTIRGMARDYPGLLGFPVTVLGKRVLIPKVPFLRHFGWMEDRDGI